MKTCDLHLHSKDLFDSDNNAALVCKKEAELGAKAVALTQHGVASGIESFKKAAKKHGLKFIPGIETYIRRGTETTSYAHMVLLAKSDTGWKALCRAISATQSKDGTAVMTKDDLWRFFGPGTEGHSHVICMTACVSGLLGKIFSTNSEIDKEVVKMIKKRKIREVTAAEISAAEKEKADADNACETACQAYDNAKKLAAARFAKREKAVSKIKDEQERKKEEEQLAADKEASAQAAKEKQTLKENEQKAKKEAAEKNKILNDLMEAAEKMKDVTKLNDMKVSDDEIWKRAENTAEELRTIFGKDDIYAEVQYHGIDIEREVYPKVAALARKMGIPIVATNDVHTIDNSEEELLRRRMLRSLRYETWSEDNIGDDQLYIKTDEEMAEWIAKILPADVVEEAMSNIMTIVDKCNVEFKIAEHYPKYRSADGKTSEEVFDQLVEDGVRELYPEGLPKGYRERISMEADTMKKMGYVDYHLVVRDFMDYASEYDSIPFNEIANAPVDRKKLRKWKTEHGYTQKVGLSTGSGRGSAVGSLVCDLLHITKLDPIPYNLYFERFLNPERISMPDIDSDISRTVRPRVIDYVKDKYGTDCVCAIMTQNAQAPRGAVRNAARCYGLFLNRDNKENNGARQFLSLADQIAKKIPMEVGISFNTRVNEDTGQTLYEWLLEEYKGSNNKDAREIIKWSKVFEGCFTAYGAHAAGIVITDGTPVSDIVPLRWNDKLGIYTTQCDMVEVEENGMLKFDFLGLKTIDIINDCLWQLHAEGEDIDVFNIPLDDADVYREIFTKGRTDSVFQFESQGMKQMLRRFKPTRFEDLIILVSMFRPGPLQYLDGVIDVKNGRKPLTFLTPELEPILGSTYGGITYQEQVMLIFQRLAGYTLGGADLVRRAMSKKKMSVLEKERSAFIYGDPDRKDIHGKPTPIRGCVKNGIDESIANELFDQMTEFAKYAFNASHAAAYAYNAYITGYLKYHYPAEFLMAAMNWAEKTQVKDPVPGLMAEAKAMGVNVCAPDVTRFGARFATDGQSIYFGLSAVKSVGASAAEIIKERDKRGGFTSFPEFYRRCQTKKDALENLIYAGALDRFTDNRQALVETLPDYKKQLDVIRKKESFLKTANAMLPYVDELTSDEEVIEKQAELGLHKELTKATTADKLQKRIDNAHKALEQANADYEAVTMREVKEDMEERMKREHELLGAYVTRNPLDDYPEYNEIPMIDEVTLDTGMLYGIVTGCTVKKRKKDGKEMAFLVIEDKTGMIRANVFTSCYEREKEKIQEGNILILKGKMQEDERTMNDDTDDTDVSYELNVNEVITVPKKEDDRGYLVDVTSIAVFHLFKEKEFRRKYGCPYGRKLYIRDNSMNEIREMKYRVSDSLITFKGVTQYDQ